jgi:16S rRNA (cytosine967-C5)-methyltransferase
MRQSMTTDPALAARRAAIALLEGALSGRGGFEHALAGPDFSRLGSKDRGFARALTLSTLRHLGPIDAALAGRLQREPPPRVRTLLRLGMAQAFWLDVPDFAAVDTSVALTAKSMRGLVNAVLRGQIRDGRPVETPDCLAPGWLLARWRNAYGADSATAIAAVIAQEPAADVSLRDPADDIVDIVGERLDGGSLRTALRGDPIGWPGFAEGRWWLQDAAAAIPARLLRPAPRKTILDLCAAPGGKCLQLAAAGATVTALDRSAQRLRRLNDNLARMRLSAEVVTADVLAWKDERLFDAVLLDAPCSATGTFRRHPDVLWNARPGDIAPLAAAQARQLEAAARRTKAGGVLAYSVCSLEPEEGEAQAATFLRAHPEFETAAVSAGEGGAPAASVTAEGWLRILPQHLAGGLDGFFIARFRRR